MPANSKSQAHKMAHDDALQILREVGIECDEVLEVNILGTPPGPVAQGYKEYTDAAIIALAKLVVERQTMLYAVLDAVERFTNIEAWMDWSKFYDWLQATYPDLAARCEARDE